MYRILKNDFSVACLGSISTMATLPATKNGWLHTFGQAIEISGYDQKDNSEKVIDRTLEAGFYGKIQCPVHCECHLLMHFSRKCIKVPPLSYMGVSKLSCAGCAAVFEAWNSVVPSHFSVRGSHGKRSFPWAFPPIRGSTQDKITGIAYGTLATPFGEAMFSFGYARQRPSDSCVGIADSSLQPTNPETIWFVNEGIKAYQKELEGIKVHQKELEDMSSEWDSDDDGSDPMY
jgi:hypothetical protein